MWMYYLVYLIMTKHINKMTIGMLSVYIFLLNKICIAYRTNRFVCAGVNILNYYNASCRVRATVCLSSVCINILFFIVGRWNYDIQMIPFVSLGNWWARAPRERAKWMFWQLIFPSPRRAVCRCKFFSCKIKKIYKSH